MPRRYCRFFLSIPVVAVLLVFSQIEHAIAQSSNRALPTPEQFASSLTSCAAGAEIKLNADLVGSLKSIYEAQRTQGAASFSTQTEFLKLMPEGARLEAYKLYTQCIREILR